ncbi:nitroreductase family protein [Arthrobacter sp. U41]|uniref:nitroreductase family protein n=1 Tax=Arthrobacter sp. U41 TaxID=1849032 RepID=UPI0018D3BF35|nr:nitroreductase family protein [Arthrobacter sp. U41]
MKRMIKQLLPAPMLSYALGVKTRLTQRRESILDRRRYERFSAPDDSAASVRLSDRQLETQLTKDYHRVEKGLALNDPRRPFGAAVLGRLDMLLPLADARGVDDEYVAYARSARVALLDWNESGAVSAEVSPVRDDVEREIGAEGFFASRRSIRDFDPRPVPEGLLTEAVRLAIHTPSVCNRQSWRVRFYTDADDKASVLSYQNGNAGIGDVPVVALVTVDARLSAGVGERNQPWIEGGLFSMSLVWALHSLGVDSCMLNMSQPNNVTTALRAKMGIPEYELIIMQIAVGYGRDGHRVARSPRRATSEVMIKQKKA